MAWVKPEFSRRKVDAAGQYLSGRSAGSIESTGHALEIVNNWRSSHSFPLKTMRTYLSTKSSEVDSNSLVAQRVKRLSSIESKLTRFSWLKLSRMQDIGGCRAVLPRVGQIQELVDLYLASRIKHKLVHSDDYIANPKDSGYRGHHLVYQYRSDRNQTYNNLRIEIQIRSRLQHAWATAVETVGTFTEQALKSSQGGMDWLRLFALMGTAIAIRERRPPVPCTPGDKSELLDEIGFLAEQLDVVSRLRAYRTMTRHIHRRVENARYFLLRLDIEERRITVSRFSARALDDAMAAYTRMEAEVRGDLHGDVVLVAVESVSALRTAYPNYFLDTTMFLREVERCTRSGVE